MHRCVYKVLAIFISYTGTPLAAPDGVTVVSEVESTSVTVSSQAVEDADRYTVTFTQTMGSDQLGLCREASHTASVSVDTTSASNSVGQSVDPNIRDMLRAYTTYFITVVAESDERISSEGSVPVTVTTAQTSMCMAENCCNITVISIFSLYRCCSSSSQCHGYSCELHCHLCPCSGMA